MEGIGGKLGTFSRFSARCLSVVYRWVVSDCQWFVIEKCGNVKRGRNNLVVCLNFFWLVSKDSIYLCGN